MESRTNNTIKNIYSGLLYQIVNVLLNLVTRKIFIVSFGSEILGINGVLLNVISMLSLTELGIGIAISQSLYKPIADGNFIQVNKIMHLFAKIYKTIGGVVLGIGIIFFPLLKLIINTNIRSDVVYIAFLFLLLDTSASYFLAYRQNLFIASQKKYILNIIFIISMILLNLIQISAMILLSDYLVYLGIKLCWDIIQNLIVYRYTEKVYPYLKDDVGTVSEEYKQNLIKNVKALVVANLSTYMIFSTDNIVLSIVSGTVAVGLYSNYSMIIMAVKGFISQIFQGVTASLGNYVALKNQSEVLDLFYKIYFFNFWTATFCAASLFTLISKFITLWIGKEFVLPVGVVLLLVWNFYSDMMRSTIEIIRNAAGLYSPYPFFKYWMLIEAVLNIAISFALGFQIGIYGVFIGTAVSGVISCYVMPWNVYKYVFQTSSGKFYKRYVFYQVYSVFIVAFTYYISNVINVRHPMLNFLLDCILCVIIPNGIIFLTCKKTPEFKYALGVIKNKILKV